MSAEYTTLDAPRTFWHDHEYRGLADDVEVVKILARKVRVRLTDEQLSELRSDAAFYASEFRSDEEPYLRGLAASAAATVRAIDRYEEGR